VQSALVRHIVAPAFWAAFTIVLRYEFEKTMMGTTCSSGRARTWRMTSMPWIFGNMRSTTTRSGRTVSSSFNAVSPSPAASTLNPSFSRTN
jgi:hypothetical protein